MNEATQTIDLIREFVLTQFPLARERHLSDEDSLLEGGIVDSLGVLDIVGFLEDTFDVEMSDDDLVADSFETIQGIADLVASKQNAGRPG